MNEGDFYDEVIIPPELLEIIKQETPIEEEEEDADT